MKKIIINKVGLKEEDITEVVKRVKALIINSKNEIMLGYSYHEYQFPGGHVEDGEELLTAVNREIKEETGINLEIESEPFAKIEAYYKDSPVIGENSKIEIYYYVVKTDERPKIRNTDYTEEEKDGDFVIRYIPLDKVEEELVSNAIEYGDENGIAKEMISILSVYCELKRE